MNVKQINSFHPQNKSEICKQITLFNTINLF